MSTQKNHTSYKVRPDHMTPEQIQNVIHKKDIDEGVIIYDKPNDKLLANINGTFEEVVSSSAQLIGWQDFADSNTSEASPLVQSNVNGGELHLTNNNNDTLTDGNTTVNGETTLEGVNDLWNTTTNTFDFKDTGLGKNDIVNFRFHTNISASIINQDFGVRLDFYDDLGGTGNFIFSLSQHVATETLSAGVFRERLTQLNVFIGESILNGSAKAYLVGTKSFEVEVIGWNLQIFKISR